MIRKEWLSTEEAERLSEPLLGRRIPRATWKRWASAPEPQVPARESFKGSRRVYEIHRSALESHGQALNYKRLRQQWVREQTTGYLTGRHIGKRGLQANEYGMAKFWQYLGHEPDPRLVTPDNLKTALAAVPIDYDARRCHYSMRDQMYKGFTSFYKMLIREGYRSPADMHVIKQCKPRRIFPPAKTRLQENQLDKLLNFNRNYLAGGRSSFDVELTHIIIMMLAWAGLRRAELIRLPLSAVDLHNRLIHVIDGKGHKNRTVGIAPELAKAIEAWLQHRPVSKADRLLVQENGRPVTETVVKKRIQNIKKCLDVNITAHGLRRTFATLFENRGMPWSFMRLSLGHSSIETTQQYIMNDEQEAAAWLQTGGRLQQQPADPIAQILKTIENL